MIFTARQTATLLAALRNWQMEVSQMEDGEFSEHFEGVEGGGLDPNEIDNLCEAINFDSHSELEAVGRQLYAATEYARNALSDYPVALRKGYVSRAWEGIDTAMKRAKPFLSGQAEMVGPNVLAVQHAARRAYVEGGTFYAENYQADRWHVTDKRPRRGADGYRNPVAVVTVKAY